MLGLQFDVQILTSKLAEHWKYMIQKPKADLSTMVIAPMPGMVKSVSAQVGDQVRQEISDSCFRFTFLANWPVT